MTVTHKDLTGAELHVPGYMQSTDPGAIGAGKYWIDTSDGTGNWVLKTRNASDDGWETVAGGGGGNPIGTMIMWPTDTAPTGYLLCYGQAVSRTTYSDLFTAIGTTFGVGDGSTTFNLPDMRGRIPLGQDDMGGTSANRVTATEADSLGGAAGAEDHTLTTSEMPAHTHNIPIRTSNNTGASLNGGTGYSTTGNWDVTASTGGGGAHNNLQPSLTLNYAIKA